MDHRWCVVLSVGARPVGVGKHRPAQHVVCVQVALPHACVDHVLDAHFGIPAQLHADLQKHVDDAGVLANGALAQGAQARVDQHLLERRLGRRGLFLFIGLGHAANEVRRMVVGDVLQRVRHALNQIVLLDDVHECFPIRK